MILLFDKKGRQLSLKKLKKEQIKRLLAKRGQ